MKSVNPGMNPGNSNESGNPGMNPGIHEIAWIRGPQNTFIMLVNNNEISESGNESRKTAMNQGILEWIRELTKSHGFGARQIPS